MASQGTKLGIIVLLFQAICFALFVFFADYDDSANASHPPHSRSPDKAGSDPQKNEVSRYYPMFQDVHVMVFIGFGFLMTFLKKYGFSSVGFNLLLAALALQWAMLLGGLVHSGGAGVKINIVSLITADFAAAAVLISFGAVLGKLSPFQVVVMAIVEVVFYTVNEYVGVGLLRVADVGGSMFIHTFGAYFGLAVARVVYTMEVKDSANEGSSYHGDLFSMIGTVFLWMYWPSFNGALAPGDDQHRAVINTYLSLAASCLVTFAVSALVTGKAKLDMVHIQNATLAGGVAIGTSADLMVRPWGAVLIGGIAGILSTVGYRYLTPLLNSKIKLHDTCGVNNLHGMPGILGAIAGAIAAGFATVDVYGYSMYEIFPVRAPAANTTALHDIQVVLPDIGAGIGRSAIGQTGYQVLALGVTVIIAIVGGSLTGLLIRLPFFDQPKQKPLFDDSLWWETPDDCSAGEISVDKHLMEQSPEDSKI
ncbi:Ammonium transporter Rh type B-B [Lamellibrachia satsuma]|nr:Ammonium transporter Rh type B-B [Lamellibrachia satsuma]